jgi:hypothetical protein
MKKTLDFIIRVDRSIKPTYPKNWKPHFPEFELSGPTEYDLRKLIQWQNKYQKYGIQMTTGEEIYLDGPSISDCANVMDLVAIKQKGIEVFRAVFQGKMVFGWKSVAENYVDDVFAPLLVEEDEQVALHWYYIGRPFDHNCVALRFPLEMIT